MALSQYLNYVTRTDPETGLFYPAESRRKIFLSYKKSDNLYNLRDRTVECILDALDCAVWYDSALTPGVDYDEEILQAIRDSDAVVLLLTPNILRSAYVWDVEITAAVKMRKGIIPIALGISQEDLTLVEQKLGHRQLLSGGYLQGEENATRLKFLEDLGHALHYFVVSMDLAMQISRFFASRKHLLPFRALSMEQLYVMAFGYLKGIGITADPPKGSNLLSSLLHIPAEDSETRQLQAAIACELMLFHRSESNPEAAIAYGRQAMELGSVEAAYHLGMMYRNGMGVEKDSFSALELLTRSADGGYLPAMREVYPMWLSGIYHNGRKISKDYSAAEHYARMAANLGDFSDACGLAALYWNYDRLPDCREKVLACFLSDNAMGHPDSGRIHSYLNIVLPGRPGFNPGSFTVGACTIGYSRAYDSSARPRDQRLGEIVTEQGSFYLWTDRKDEKRTSMLLMRDGKVLYEFSCWAAGFGDVSSFDITRNAEEGTLSVRMADFCHYDRETTFETYTFVNPASNDLLLLKVREEDRPGRRTLTYSTLWDGPRTPFL